MLTLVFEGIRKRIRSKDLPLVWMQALLVTPRCRAWVKSDVRVWARYAMWPTLLPRDRHCTREVFTEPKQSGGHSSHDIDDLRPPFNGCLASVLILSGMLYCNLDWVAVLEIHDTHGY